MVHGDQVPPAVSVPTTAPAAERVSGRESRQASMFARAQGTRLGIGLHARASVPVEHDKAITAVWLFILARPRADSHSVLVIAVVKPPAGGPGHIRELERG